MNFTKALVRTPGIDFASGITTSHLGKPDYQTALKQHQSYIDALKKLKLEVEILEPLIGFPDAYFVEDTAVIIPEIAIITNPGAQARKGETDSIEIALKKYKETIKIKAPAIIDGGDIMLVDKHFFIGISERTNIEGGQALKEIAAKYGYKSTFVKVAEGLHFKSSVNYIGNNNILLTKAFFDCPELNQFNKLLIDKEEEHACNSLLINNTVIVPAGYPKTKKIIHDTGMPIIEVETTEAKKMDGGLSCMSLRF